MTRRTYGSGTVYQRDDGLWVARIEAGISNTGTRRRITVSARSKADCLAKLKARQKEIARNGLPTEGVTRATVNSWAKTWLDAHAKTARPKYYATDAGNVHKWIVPTLGRRRLTDLNPADMRQLRAAVTEPDPPRFPNGRSTTTARAVHELFLRMLKDATIEGHAVDERLFLLKPPGKAVSDRTAMTIGELRAVLKVIAARPDRSRWMSAILNGMRKGESLGLTWACVDLEGGLLDVSWQLQDLPYNVRGDRSSGFRVPDGHESRQLIGARHLTRPKTGHGERVLPIARWFGLALEEARAQWTPNPWDLVWTDMIADGKQRPIRENVDRERWHAIQAEAGVAHPSGRPYHLHETRHSAVSMMLADGEDRSVIARIVGQSKLVEEYVHVNTDQARAALERRSAHLQIEE